jgi:hypothetical protein
MAAWTTQFSAMKRRVTRYSDFPEFYRALAERDGAETEHILPATETEIAELETQRGAPLPDSMANGLECMITSRTLRSTVSLALAVLILRTHRLRAFNCSSFSPK